MEQQTDYPKCLDMKEYQKKNCKWSLDNAQSNGIKKPHSTIRHLPQKIYNNVLDFIGNTPMIRLNNIPKAENIKCELLAKCEFYNPGGSTKDRIGYRMIEELESKGKLEPGYTLIEATSGNTGIGVAMVGAAKGYKVIITLPEKMSQEKCDTLKGLGAKIIRTPTELPGDHVNSHIGVAIKLNGEIEDSVIPDQYVNVGNALAHYDSTAEEIWEQCEGKLDYVVISAGTGGTITGIGRKLKEKNSDIKVIGVDPHGSILALPDNLNDLERGKGYKVEGIGYDFIPKNCDSTIADTWYKTYDKESFYWARRLIKEEGLLVGGSSGCVMDAAMQFCRDLPEGKRVVLVFVDSIRNYMTKFLNDDWMIENGFYQQEEVDKDLVAFGGEEPIKNFIDRFKVINTVEVSTSVDDVLKLMDKFGYRCFPVLAEGKKDLLGIITKKQLTSFLLNLTIKKNDPIMKAVIKDFKKLESSQQMRFLSKAFLRHEFVVVVNDGKYHLVEPDDMLSIIK